MFGCVLPTKRLINYANNLIRLRTLKAPQTGGANLLHLPVVKFYLGLNKIVLVGIKPCCLEQFFFLPHTICNICVHMLTLIKPQGSELIGMNVNIDQGLWPNLYFNTKGLYPVYICVEKNP